LSVFQKVQLNGTPITPTPSPSDWGPIGEFNNGPFSANNQFLFIAGENVLLISDIDYYSGGPSGAAFYATVTYSAVPEPSTFALFAIAAVGLFAWQRRQAA
jgi:hypothetical protein